MAVVFSSVGYQTLSSLIYFIGLSILTVCASNRLPVSSWKSMRQMSWPRLLVFLIMVDSWFFLFCSGLLIFGIGLETSTAACTAAVLLCVIFYGSSKVLIYCFLVEKVHLVWSPTTGIGGRLKSRVWLACMSLNVGYLVVVFLMCLGLIHYHRDDGLCIIGIKPFSSITLLVFDLFITIILNVLFLFPLIRSKIANPRLRAVAIRTAFASIVALVTSTVNIAVVTVMRGHELGWVCLGSCAADVILNALTIFYITSSNDVSGHLTDGYENDRQITATDGRSVSLKLASMSFKKSKTQKGAAHHGAPGRGVQVMVTTRTSMERDDGDSRFDSEVKAAGVEAK